MRAHPTWSAWLSLAVVLGCGPEPGDLVEPEYGTPIDTAALAPTGDLVTREFQRFYNSSTGDHFYSARPREQSAAPLYGYAFEGVTGHVFAVQQPGTVALHRYYNGRDNFYTITDSPELRGALAGLGYNYINIAGGVYPAATTGATPLYRMYSGAIGDHFYTTSRQERDQAVASLGYADEGIEGYLMTQPVARPVEACSSGSQTRLRYLAPDPPFFVGCKAETQTRSCSNGQWTSWSGSFASETCTPRPARVMPIGDSITEQWAAESWRYQLQALLRGSGYHQFEFVGSMTDPYDGSHHEGHAGWRTGDILDGRPDAQPGQQGDIHTWAPTYRPDVALIYLGINDFHSAIYGSPSMSLEEARTQSVNNMAAIVDVLRQTNPAIKIYLARVTPSVWVPNAEVVAYNDWNAFFVAAAKSTPASPITMVDLYTGFDLATDTDDQLHPNETGAKKIASRWHAQLTADLARAGIAPGTR